jgi:pimeloyl-ACP methyl ester carboxylesterase
MRLLSADRVRVRRSSLGAACVASALLLAASGVANAAPPSDSSARPAKPPACFDATPHETLMVPVQPRVRLEVLDFGGRGKARTMVLLTGLGDNAHVYDQFAYQFTEFFHVLGVTRRGYLPSSQPLPWPDGSGYSVDRRARDDIAVLDALGIDKAVFVGHSVAGSELSELGLKHPGRTEALVYLDAFDLARRFVLPDIPGPPYTEADASSLSTQIAAQARFEDIIRPVAEICHVVEFDEHGALIGTTTPSGVPGAILAGVQAAANPPVDWSKMAVPRIGLFNQPSVAGRLPYYPYLDPADKALFDARWPAIVDWYNDRLAEFALARPGMPVPVVHRLPDAPHYFYFNRQAFVVLKMREFLLGTAQP